MRINGSYKVDVYSAPHSGGWRAADLGGSWGRAHMRGDKIESIMIWMAEHFDDRGLDFADGLPRFNLMDEEGCDEATALSECRRRGDAWLEAHASLIRHYGIRVYRWDGWLGHTDFAQTLDGFTQGYQKDPIFAAAVDADIAAFRERCPGKNPVLARRFILEELAAGALMGRERRSISLNPARELDSFAYARSLAGAGLPDGLANQKHATFKLRLQRNVKPAILSAPYLMKAAA
ncbi:MAG: hypothetical protein IPI58_06600 [Alphaproteobacteria bacterium]|nr:MAG: hypothetical protein IPI58_06600 [Alphaproteobacteria bacterium]